MSKVIIEIDTDNFAFADDNWEYEIVRILQDLIKSGLSKHYLSDINGNTVGKLKIYDLNREFLSDINGNIVGKLKIYD